MVYGETSLTFVQQEGSNEKFLLLFLPSLRCFLLFFHLGKGRNTAIFRVDWLSATFGPHGSSTHCEIYTLLQTGTTTNND